MSALPPKADIERRDEHVRLVPKADLARCSKLAPVSVAFLHLWLAVGASGQPHREHRALARFARHGHVAAHHARELAGDSKAEPRPAIAPRGQGIGLGEVLEQFRLLFCGHTDAAVRDGKLDPVAAVRHLAHPQRDLALFRKLAGVAQEIKQNLLQPHGVRGERANVLWRFDDEAVLVLLGKLSRSADDLVDKPSQIRSGLRSSLPASIFDRSRISLMRLRRWVPAAFTRRNGSSAFSVPKRAAFVDIISVRPMMALSGVRSSWLMLARNCDLRSLASASCRLLSWISSNSRTFSMAIAAWSAKVDTSSTCFSVNGRASERVNVRTPVGTPSRNIGTARTVRKPPTFWPSRYMYSGSTRTSGT